MSIKRVRKLVSNMSSPSTHGHFALKQLLTDEDIGLASSSQFSTNIILTSHHIMMPILYSWGLRKAARKLVKLTSSEERICEIW